MKSCSWASRWRRRLNTRDLLESHPAPLWLAAQLRPVRAEITQPPESYRAVARHAPREVAPDESSEVRSCPKVVQQTLREPRSCPDSTNSGRVRPLFGQGWPASDRFRRTLADLGRMLARFGPNCTERFPTWPDLVEAAPDPGSRSHSGARQLFGNFWAASELPGIAGGSLPSSAGGPGRERELTWRAEATSAVSLPGRRGPRESAASGSARLRRSRASPGMFDQRAQSPQAWPR